MKILEENKMAKQRMVLLVAGVLGVISIFLPWASLMGLSVSGMKTDAWWLVVLFSLLIIGLALVGKKSAPVPNSTGLAITIIGGIQALFGIYYIIQLSSKTTSLFGVSIGGKP